MQFFNPSTVDNAAQHSDSDNDSDSGPPISLPEEDLPSLDVTHPHPRYAATPSHNHQEPPPPSFWNNALKVLCAGLLISHLVMIWTLRTDVNLLEAYHKELNSQCLHVFKMVQDMKQVEWRMVPANI
tara:strand:- start:10013 stop:10393 length:381 start_codon:yes stop_codon:yes gene_type:complete